MIWKHVENGLYKVNSQYHMTFERLRPNNATWSLDRHEVFLEKGVENLLYSPLQEHNVEGLQALPHSQALVDCVEAMKIWFASRWG